MASQVLSGAANASYTNNTGQNVRLIINYMTNVTSMTWAGVNVTASATTIGKNVETYNIRGELRQAIKGARVATTDSGSGLTETFFAAQISPSRANLLDYRFTAFSGVVQNSGFLPTTGTIGSRTSNFGPPSNFFISSGANATNVAGIVDVTANLFYVPTSMVKEGGNFPVELMLANGQAFSAVCGAFNAIVIREDGN